MRKAASIALVIIGWPLMLVSALYAFNGLVVIGRGGDFLIGANNAGPGLILLATGALGAGIGAGLIWLGRRLRERPRQASAATRG